MNVALACGGTGGHIFPGLATAEELVDRGHEVALWLSGKADERRLVEGWKGTVIAIPSKGFSDGVSTRAVGTVWTLYRAANRCTELMRDHRPDVVVGMGSYASVGPLWAAKRLKIPYVLHAADVLPGRTVSLFSRWATAIAGSFEETRYYLRRKDIVLTGMPIRRRLAGAAREIRHHPLDPDRLTILVMGGSQGAHSLNETVTSALCECYGAGHRLQVIHLAGAADCDRVRRLYAEAGMPVEVHDFVQDMAEVYTRTDLAVCRSGAGTCAELSAFGVPALLVPYPHATKDHQTANARAMEKLGAADVVPQLDLSVEWLKDYIGQCIRSPGRLARMSAATRKRAQASGAEALADLVERVAAGRLEPEPAAIAS